MSATIIGAKYSRFGRDLYWRFHHNNESHTFAGYDDDYWWNNIAVKPGVHELNGYKYSLDYLTSVVTVEKLT